MQIIHLDEQYIERRYFRYNNICGPRKSGKSSFLSALIQYFGCVDVNESAKSNIEDESEENEWTQKHCHPIIFLDFSDCVVRTYDEAIKYIKAQISKLYLSLLYEIDEECIHHYTVWEEYLNIIDGSCTERELAGSLRNMVHLIRTSYSHAENCTRPMIFIDEVSRPLLYAAEYEFEDRLRSFYDTFLDIDHYELTGGIYTTSYAPANTDVHFRLKYIEDKPINTIPALLEFGKKNGLSLQDEAQKSYFWPHTRYFNRTLNLKECFHKMVCESDDLKEDCDLNIHLDAEVHSFISQKRKWIEESRIKEEKEIQRRKEQERIEYKSPLSDACNIPSKFAGIRSLNVKITDEERHTKLNSILKELYLEHGREIRSDEVYDKIQSISGSDDRINGINKLLEELQLNAEANKTVYKSRIDLHDHYWGRFDLSRQKSEPGYSDMALIKVYISVADEDNILPVFGDAVKFLIQQGKHRFHAKVARRRRSDHICLWTAGEDFFALENYLKKYDKDLITPLPFIAYRNKLGISREFYSWDSHNGVQASMISLYLKHIENIADVEVLTMYSEYVKAWNGELPDDHYLTKEYKRSNTQEFLILIETLDVLLGNSKITDDHFLLNGDEALWMALGESKNWWQVGKKMSSSTKLFP